MSQIRVLDTYPFELWMVPMLKVNVGLSRKVSQDYNSTGFSVNLEGEICVPLDDPQMILVRIKELYDLAEESLSQQIDRHQHASISEPVNRPTQSQPTPQNGNGHAPKSSETVRPSGNRVPSEFVPATNKQISFLLNLGKRQGLNKPQLESRIAGLIGRQVDVYELSKQEAGLVLDDLSAASPKPISRKG